ncbi:MAG: 50S ribosomal protein L25 [Acidobacteriota bacterium]|nr:50S ribosomal protein L25 [Acidobacteriota bacterium]
MSFMIRAEMREVFGKNASRRLRKEGKLPAVLYGKDIQNVSLILDKKDIFAVLKSETGENTIFKVSFDSKKKNAMIKEFQKDPVTDELLHADLILIAMDEVVNITIPLVLIGEAVGVKAEGGFVDFVNREVEVECLPKDIPENIEIDISDLHLHQSSKVEALSPPEGVTITTDGQSVIVLIEAPSKEEEVEEVEEVEEEITEEEEPEIIKKEKAEEEEEKKE